MNKKPLAPLDRIIVIARDEPFNIKHLDSKEIEIYSQTMARIIGQPRYKFLVSNKSPDYLGKAIQYMPVIAPSAIMFLLSVKNSDITPLRLYLSWIFAFLSLISSILYITFLPTMWRNRTRNLIEKSMVTDEDIETYMNTQDCVDDVINLLNDNKVTLTEKERGKANDFLKSRNSTS